MQANVFLLMFVVLVQVSCVLKFVIADIKRNRGSLMSASVLVWWRISLLRMNGCILLCSHLSTVFTGCRMTLSLERRTYSYVNGVRLLPTFDSRCDSVQKLLQKTQDINPGLPQLEKRCFRQRENFKFTRLLFDFSFSYLIWCQGLPEKAEQSVVFREQQGCLQSFKVKTQRWDQTHIHQMTNKQQNMNYKHICATCKPLLT